MPGQRSYVKGFVLRVLVASIDMLNAQGQAISTYEHTYVWAVRGETESLQKSRKDIVAFGDKITKILGFATWELSDFTLEPDEFDTILIVPEVGQALITPSGGIHVPINWSLQATANGQNLEFKAFWKFLFKHPTDGAVHFEGWDDWIDVNNDKMLHERASVILPQMLESLTKRAEKAGRTWVRSNQQPDP